MLQTVGVRYPRAPIAEAVFDIRVDELEPAVLSRIRPYVDVGYPSREESVLSGAEIEHGPLGISTKSVRKMNGFRFTSEDGKQIVQMRSDGFTFSRLAPYEEWNVFYAESRRLWLAYINLVGRVRLNRIALRYINEIQVPSSELRIDDYLSTRPEISGDMPAPTSGFFLSLEVPIPALGVISHIVETVLPNADESLGARLVLDIDVFCPLEQVEFTDSTSMDHLDTAFTKLRRAKNHVFEASITDKSRRMFQ